MTQLPLFDDSTLNRVLCIVAHPDDMEYGASAAVAKWTAQGKDVSYLLLTRGEAGIRGLPPEEVAPLRAAEQSAACSIVGVDDLEILDFPDGLLEPDQKLRHAIAKKIREFRPDAIVATTWRLETPWGLSHVDHRSAGVATIDAVRDADNPWLFTDLHEQGLEPWKAGTLIVNGNEPTHTIALSADNVDAGVRSLEAHTVYLEALSDHPAPREMITEITRGGGEMSGTDFALPVQIIAM